MLAGPVRNRQEKGAKDMARLFGTDGVRGIANEALTPEIAFRLGEAAGYFFGEEGSSKIVIGKDTRTSGDMLEAAMVAGITSAGADVLLCGIVPTPAVAYFTRMCGASGGIVISASHNPPEYNGIKFFGPDGFKLSDGMEKRIEDFVAEGGNGKRPLGDGIGRVRHVDDATSRYVSHVMDTIDVDLEGLTVAVDCGHGAASITTPRALKELGAKVIAVNCDFDGAQINVGCGSTDLTMLRELILTHKVDIGIAHDGDADRVIAMDERGNVVDGDTLLAVCATHLHSKGALPEATVVATVMSNLGFQVAMQNQGVRVLQAKVGDRYVLEEMRASGANLGGEQSGHIIFLEHNSTGDGLVAALQLASVMKERTLPLSELTKVMERYPQVLTNVRVRDTGSLAGNEAINEAVCSVESVLDGNGRVLVRASGTEPLVRIMVEAQDEDLAGRSAASIARVVERELG